MSSIVLLKLLPIGNGLPRITLDLRSHNSSIAPFKLFSTITLTVSWKEAADNQEAHSLATCVRPNISLCHFGKSLLSFLNTSHTLR